ncbi:hypothetical protein NDU88_009813 [Pleurodeles waltl]|uniref:Uncharacterized protein n=1 Tax=Pleurodeles waltl TaxID=8319 RepID=A0AAV7S237_PLEWA|nr:hypothetical protein NDU88_009813 [Pleurodeles waltl]
MIIDLGIMQEERNKLKARVATHETTIAELHPIETTTHAQIKNLRQEVELLQCKVDGSEGCLRLNDIRMVGLPERIDVCDKLPPIVLLSQNPLGVHAHRLAVEQRFYRDYVGFSLRHAAAPEGVQKDERPGEGDPFHAEGLAWAGSWRQSTQLVLGVV